MIQSLLISLTLFYIPLSMIPRTLSWLFSLPEMLFLDFWMVGSSLLLSLDLNISFLEKCFLVIRFEITTFHITFFYFYHRVLATLHFALFICLFSVSTGEYKLHEKMYHICLPLARFSVLRKEWVNEWVDKWLSFMYIVEKN